MALVECRECGEQISDQAAACPRCGLPKGAKVTSDSDRDDDDDGASEPFVFGLVALAMIILALFGYIALSGRRQSEPPAAAQSPPVDAVAFAPRWKLKAEQVDMHFVYMPPSELRNQAQFDDAARAICSGKTHCFVNFWMDEQLASARLPLSETQVATQIAAYRQNTSSGLSQWSWACRYYPEKQQSGCF